jgi:hypothetical protein
MEFRDTNLSTIYTAVSCITKDTSQAVKKWNFSYNHIFKALTSLHLPTFHIEMFVEVFLDKKD